MFSRLVNKLLNRRIYLDYASLTPIDPRVQSEMSKYSSVIYANPSSFYKEGVAAKEALKKGRDKVAEFLHAQPSEIVFTSGGTESNNLAIIGTIESLHEKGVAYDAMHIIISAIEHSSVRECANYLNSKGVTIDTVPVDSNGIVILDELKKKLQANTVIVSIMTVNNEIGSIQPIKEIAKLIRHFRNSNSSKASVNAISDDLRKDASSKPLTKEMLGFDFQDFAYPIFHTDASQAVLYGNLNTENLGVDLLTIDGTKVYGPRGIGALYVKRGTPILPILYGGGQEQGRRSGTENLPSIMGLAKALEIAKNEREVEAKRVEEIKALFLAKLKEIRPDITLNGGGLPRSDLGSPHILNISVPKIDNEFFLLQLDAKGIACSTKSSCLRDEDESYVLKSIGADSRRSLRFSFGRWTTMAHITKTIKVIRGLLAKP